MVLRGPLVLVGTLTVALPEPVPVPVTAAQDVEDDVHAQVVPVVTDTVAVPPPALNDSDVGDTE